MIGGLILKRCLDRNDVGVVTSISRRPLGISHPRLNEVIHNDFLNYASIQNHFSNQDICFYCLGVYTGQVPKEEFIKITVDFTRSFAEALKQNSPQAAFCFLSGEGADRKETSRILFAREKGRAENILLKLQFRSLAIFRPGYIYPVSPRKEPNAMYVAMRWLYKNLLSKVSPEVGVTSERLADVMIDVGFNGSSMVTFENKDIRNLQLKS